MNKKVSLLLLFCITILTGLQTQAQMGKIWYTDNNLFVNLPHNGIVVLDNVDPRNPKKLGYIDLLGNVDLAVNGNYLYANSYQDLVVLDISNIKQPKEVHRVSNTFTHRRRNSSANLPQVAWNPGNSNTLENVLRDVARRSNRIGTINIGSNSSFGINPTINSLNTGVNNQPSSPKGVSKGGSMACFTITNGYLYAIDAQDLVVFSLENPAAPKAVSGKIRINTDIETIFTEGNKLYIGSQTGMYIYDITSAENPVRKGHYRHTRSCDPVVVKGNYAYVTLRSGSQCGGGLNQLDVIDISNPSSPKRVKSYRMTSPNGLGIDGNMLFVCDGRAGMKVYDISNPTNLALKAHYRGINTYDVIPVSGKKNLIISAKNLIIQYDYSNNQKLEKLSTYRLQ